ncbi:MAG: uracil phosphoribosyltransferase, partial [Methanobacterium sp.]|nr:uracil phosphoribosyltransferase [Methanobacterium sp.]
NTLEKEEVTVQTPLGIAKGVRIKDKNDIVVVNVLRAAIPLVEGIMRVFRNAQYGVVGASRKDEPPFTVEVGYFKLPPVDDKIVVIADPMLATGNTMNAILKRIYDKGIPRRVVLLNVIASKTGIELVEREHSDVDIYIPVQWTKNSTWRVILFQDWEMPETRLLESQDPERIRNILFLH